MMKTETLPLSIVFPNEGQIDGVPENPRKWSTREMNKLVRSVKETPELVELRPPIVVRCGDIYVTIGGNMRLAAMKEACITDAECIILEDLTTGKIKEIAIKDNVQMGRFDMDALADEWDDLPLSAWGIPSYETDEEETVPGDADPVDDRVTIEIQMSPDEYAFTVDKLREIATPIEDAVVKLLRL